VQLKLVLQYVTPPDPSSKGLVSNEGFLLV